MPKVQNYEIVASLARTTEQGKTEWQATPHPDSFTAGLPAGWTATITKSGADTWLTVNDEEDNTIVRITDEDVARVSQLHEDARRQALKIDERLGHILNELNKTE